MVKLPKMMSHIVLTDSEDHYYSELDLIIKIFHKYWLQVYLKMNKKKALSGLINNMMRLLGVNKGIIKFILF